MTRIDYDHGCTGIRPAADCEADESHREWSPVAREDQRRHGNHDQGSHDGKRKGRPQRVARRPQGNKHGRKVIAREEEQIIDREHEGETGKGSHKRAVRTALEEAITHRGQEGKRQQRSAVEGVALHELFYAHSEDRCLKQ